MKKILSSLLALSVLFGSAAYLGNPETADMNFGTQAYAADIVKSGVCGENLTWTLDSDGLLSIKGTGEMTNWKFISMTYKQYEFTDIDFDGEPVPWFEDKDSIKRVEIGSGVENIGDVAFVGLQNLESVSIPVGVTEIGNFAFFFCTSLKSVKMPVTVTNMGKEAFDRCHSLTEITVSEAVNEIKVSTFEECLKLTSVKIPASVKKVDFFAFEACPALESVFVMNPNCEIYNRVNTLGGFVDRCTIYGYENSTAQVHAEKYGYNFVAFVLGDVDFDGAVNASDASQILADYASSATGSGHILTAEELVISDVNSDGAVDSSDASTVLAYYAYTATGGELSLADFIEK